MGALVISLVWIYYATVVFFVGALMTAVIDERLRAPSWPQPALIRQPPARCPTG
jgi:membrane protein